MFRPRLLAALLLAPSLVLAQQPQTAARPAAAPQAAPTASPAQQAQLTKQNTEMTQAALRVAQMVDANQVASLWDGASSVAKTAVKRDVFVSQIGAERARLGAVVGRGQGSVTRVKYAAGAQVPKACTSTSASRPGLPRPSSRCASWCRSAWTRTRPGGLPATACARRSSDLAAHRETRVELTIELQMLGWAMLLGLVQLLAASASMTAQRGTKWNASARDGDAKPLTGVAARLDRAFRNYQETFPIFAAAVLAVSVAGRTNADTALGVQLYLWARVAYVPAYAAGIPYLRSAIWVVSFWGIVKLVRALLGW